MTTPENIKNLKDNQIFVFGSNLNGNHAGGAAAYAKQNFGATEGIGEGLTGQSYAFPTLDKKMKKVTKRALIESKNVLYRVASENTDKQFLVTKLGCGIAGFKEGVMKEIFSGEKPSNIVLPAGWSVIRGYKAFDEGLICRGMQFELGKEYVHDGEIELCASGFHFCKEMGNVYSYYNFGSVVCEIESEGAVIDEEDGNKSVTNRFRIVRVLGAKEAHGNKDGSEVGYRNTGNGNTGDLNTGNRNTGDLNTGNWNTGYGNTGDRNTGDRNTGDRNTGNWNTGDLNTGNWNTGNRNTGYRNTGDRNTGNWNTGNRNTGYRNTGDRNTGNLNTGNWNTGNRNTGYFNTTTPDDILVFGKRCKRDKWDSAYKPSFLYFETTKWVEFSEMTEEEKIRYPLSKTTGGYLKKLDYKQAFQKSYANASEDDVKMLKKLPNFNKKIFFEISGIMID